MDPHWPKRADLHVWPVNPPESWNPQDLLRVPMRWKQKTLFAVSLGWHLYSGYKAVVIWHESHSVHCVLHHHELEEDRKPSYTSEESW